MRFKFRPYTILFVPQNSKKIFKLKLPFYVVAIGSVVVLFLLSFIVYMIGSYFYIMGEFSNIEELKNRNRKLGKELYVYKMRIENIDDSLERLKALTTKLKIVSNIGGQDQIDESLLDSDIIEGIDDFSMASDVELDSEFKNTNSRLKDIENSIAYQEEELTKLGEYLAEQSALLASTPSIIPVKGWITSSFGSRIDPFTRRMEKHLGIDISARTGTPIIAPADGVISFAGTKPGYGLMLTINHGYGMTTVYGHCSKLFVAQGTRVKRGMPIAAVGSTGRSTGPHLHYEVKVNNVPVNPKKFILDSPWG